MENIIKAGVVVYDDTISKCGCSSGRKRLHQHIHSIDASRRKYGGG